jgi:excisionase family DNA binding protein
MPSAVRSRICLIAAERGGQVHGRINKLFREAAVEGLTIPEAVQVSGIGRSKLYECIADGALIARKVGAKTIILRSDLMSFMENLPRAGAEPADA